MLAAAASAVRLYPPTSELPRTAIERFAEATWAVTAAGPLRFLVDPTGFRYGEDDLAAGSQHVLSLAETLHALQVGQLVIAPALTTSEVATFLGVVGTDPHEIAARGGVRACLVAAGVGHIAVIEVSLRPSTEQGIMGLDLTLAPLEEIGAAVVDVADAWRRTAMAGTGTDDMRAAIDRLEPATRELAARRVAQALLRMPEASRRDVLASALRPDANGSRMDGMLAVVAQMNPSALARLLTLVASDVGLRGLDLARSLELPPEVARELRMLLAPSARSEEASGVPVDPEVDSTAEEMADFEEGDEPAIAAAIAAATPALAAGKALATTLAILGASPTVESVAAVGEALPLALRTGALEQAAQALHLLANAAGEPALVEAAAAARRAVSDPESIRAACRAVRPETDPAALAAVLQAAGGAGAEELFARAAEARPEVRPVLVRAAALAGETVIPAAGRLLRAGESSVAIATVRTLSAIGDKRSLPVLTQALEHLDVAVRRATVTALAEFGTPEAAAVLGKALWHWDPETRRYAAQEIGRANVVDALPSLTRIMEEIYLFDRNHDLKKEVLRSLESLDSPAALPALERVASRRFIAVGRKSRELQFLARQAVERLRQARKREVGDAT